MIKQYAKLGFILAAFAAVACVGLTFVFKATEAPIEANKSKQLNESLKDIFRDAEEFAPEKLESPDQAVKFLEAYVAKRGGSPLGLAVKASGSSYGGDSVLLVGIGLDGRIAGVRVLSNLDTPGLGANAANPAYYVKKAEKVTFPGQFAGKAVGDPFEVKKDVDAITASTITSRALTKIVKAACGAAGAWLGRAAAAPAAAGGN